ncbi:unnamed protein product, partial [Adineta steineri]
CFILKYRLRDIFTTVTNNKTNINSIRQKILGYFVEIIAIYYLFTNHHEFFINSRSKDMLFPYPSSTLTSQDYQKDKDTSIFSKFLRKLYDNGEISFDIRQIKLLLQSDAYQFLNKKLENKKIGFINFFDTILRYQRETSCRSLKSICRLYIKTHIKQFPDDIKHLSLYPSMNDQLLAYLTYENKYAFESYMYLTELPDVALIKIFRTFTHIELIRFYHNFHSSKRIQNLIAHSSCLWTHIHIESTVDYNLFTYFARLLISNSSTTRQLIIDELDIICRKILYDNGFSLKKFSQLEQLIIHDEYICNTLQSLHFCSSTLKNLRLTNDHSNLSHINSLEKLNNLQITLYSTNMLQNQFNYLTNLHLKIMFDYDHNSREIFSRLPNKYLEILTLKFLLVNNDVNFFNEFNNYLNSCHYLHTLELSYLHGMCPLSLHTNINYSKYQRIIFINICHLNQMKDFIELNQYELPIEYLQLNSTANINRYASYITHTNWYTRQLISIDYIQCVTTSMNLLNEHNMIWSDKNQKPQSFESYILRSIYNVPYLMSSLRNLVITKFELSLDGLVTLMTSFPLLSDLIITDGKIDQMGSGMWDLKRIFHTITNVPQSVIQTIVMNNIQMSRRTAVQLCLITRQLISLTLNDVRILDKMITLEQNKDNNRPSFLILLKQIAQHTNQFKWPYLKSLTIGKNMINRSNLSSFIPLHINTIYSINITHLHFILRDHKLFEPTDIFFKSIKKLIKIYPKFTSFIIEFTNKYDEHFLLRNQLETLLELNLNKKVYVYSTKDDRVYRFCFDTNLSIEDNDNDDEQTSSSQCNRTFCGIPLFPIKKQRKSHVFL